MLNYWIYITLRRWYSGIHEENPVAWCSIFDRSYSLTNIVIINPLFIDIALFIYICSLILFIWGIPNCPNLYIKTRSRWGPFPFPKLSLPIDELLSGGTVKWCYDVSVTSAAMAVSHMEDTLRNLVIRFQLAVEHSKGQSIKNIKE